MDNKKINLIRIVATWLLAAVGVILAIVLFINIAPEAADNPTQEELEGQASAVSTILNYTQFLIYIVLGLIVVFVLLSVVTNFGKQKKSLITTAIMGILAAIFYGVNTSSTVSPALAEKGATDADAVMASTGIGLTIFLIAIAIILAVFMGIITKYVLKK